MPDPKAIHNIEQGIAAYRTMAAGYSAFYRELIDKGEMHADHALAMTLEYMRLQANHVKRMLDQPPSEEKD